MTRMTRKTICGMAFLTFIAVLLIFFSVATSGFENWNGATWFDYWGAGMPALPVVTPDNKPSEPAAETSAIAMAYNADNSVSYDSDFGSSRIGVQFLPSVKYNVIEKDGAAVLVLYSNNSPCEKMSVSFAVNDYMENFTAPRIFNYSDSVKYEANKRCFYISYEEMLEFSGVSASDFYNKGIIVKSTNMAIANYLSKTSRTTIIANRFDENTGASDFVIKPDVNGTIVSIPIYRRAWQSYINNDESIYKHYYGIIICNSVDFESSTVRLAYERESLQGFKGLSLDGDDAEDITSTSIVKIRESDGQEYYDVNLAKVGFLNSCNFVLGSVDGFLGALSIYVVPCTYIDGNNAVSFETVQVCRLGIEKLANPQNIRIESNGLVWDEVDGAMGYSVSYAKILPDGEEDGPFHNYTTEKVNSAQFPLDSFDEGEYIFLIRALGNLGKLYKEYVAPPPSLDPPPPVDIEDENVPLMLSAYNSGLNVVDMVILTYNIDGHIMNKFVPHGSTVSSHLYDVNIAGKEFGGWYYDSGFSRKVDAGDKLSGDVVVYARLSDLKVTDRPLTWWELYRWYVLIPCFAFVGSLAGVAGFVAIKKKRGRK